MQGERLFKKLSFILFLSLSLSAEFELISIKNLVEQSEHISYEKIHDPMKFSFHPFPMSEYPLDQPFTGAWAQTFLTRIAHGSVFSHQGFINVEDKKVVREWLPQYYSLKWFQYFYNQVKNENLEPTKVFGRVAVITRLDVVEYAHWLLDGLGAFAMLEQQGVEYDWLCVPHNRPYIKESLELLGVDPAKIIASDVDNFYIQADELIIPSRLTYRVSYADSSPYHLLAVHTTSWHVNFLRKKLLPLVDQVDRSKLSPKIFISRKNAQHRKILNEDELFELFEEQGYKKFFLEEMTFLEQVALFAQATHVAGAHGAGLTNIAFCCPGTQVIEIFQKRFDATFWLLSQHVGAKHYCIKTEDGATSNQDTVIDVDSIKNYIDQNLR